MEHLKGSGFTQKCNIDKRSSLFVGVVSDEEKRFIILPPGVCGLGCLPTDRGRHCRGCIVGSEAGGRHGGRGGSGVVGCGQVTSWRSQA